MALEMKYFVLKPSGDSLHAKASRRAMREYADTIRDEDAEFADQLHKWCADEAGKAASEN